ncbi:MAG: outer membrane beta-barrel protein, partial [Saprospiraceae bacterium]|nr:outer membrane beta-barrel protein [Saprospiraceae bacterium]
YREMGIWRISSSKRLDEFAAPVTDVDTMQGGAAGPGSFVQANEIYNNTVNYDTARILADRYNYLHLPLILQYRLSPKLKVSVGVKGSRMLSAPSEYAISDQSGSFNQNVTLSARGSNNFLYNYDILRKWDVAPLLGLGLEVGRRMSLNVNYQHGLIPFVDRSGIIDRSDYHRSLSVGLQYRML